MKKLMFSLVLFLSFLNLTAQINFEGDFESGNFNTVYKDINGVYRLTTIEDIGGRWFYFKITGVKNKLIKVQIENSDVKRPFYSYDNIDFTRFTESESPRTNYFEKTFAEDTVYVSYYVPYNYSYLQKRLGEWEKSDFVRIDTLGITENNFPMQFITLTDFDYPDEFKHQVWIHARTHPGETPSSFHFDGLVQKLLEDNDVIDFYRKNIVFYLVPFNNPEGVYYGKSRTNNNLVDQEREWEKPTGDAAVEIQLLKAKLKEICDIRPVDVFLNLHSQASPFCTFWIHTAESTSDYFYTREYQFSNLQVSDNPYFAQSDYRESSIKSIFPEGWLWDNYGDKVMALTYETPYDKYSSGDWVSNDNLYELGYRTIYALGEYLELSHPQHLVLDNKAASYDGNWESYQITKEFYSEDFMVNSDGNGSASFNAGDLEFGKYDVYAWWPTSTANSYQTNFEITAGNNNYSINKTQKTNGGQWNFIQEVELTNGHNIDVKINANNTGLVVADAVRIIFREPLTGGIEDNIPKDFILYQNYPNPFNPSTTIRFHLKEANEVQLKIFNSLGQLVTTLVDEYLNAGQHEYIFNSGDYVSLSSGIYYYQLTTGKFAETKGMTLVK